jgi:two-component system, cell cycle sensor histidine kinase and response regulator CckA
MPVIAGRYVMLSITDNGCGISEDVVPHIFEPFFTTKEQGKGTGLGLSTAYGIVKQSNGYIWVYSEPGKGTTFKTYFPAVMETVPEPPNTVLEQAEPAQPASETILVVEDDELLRGLVVRLLDGPGYKVLEAESADAALQLEKRYPAKIDLLLTDVIMPKLSGGELAAALRAKRPDLRVLFMSGYSSELVEQHGAAQPGITVMQKPFSKNALLAQVRAALRQKPSAEGEL